MWKNQSLSFKIILACLIILLISTTTVVLLLQHTLVSQLNEYERNYADNQYQIVKESLASALKGLDTFTYTWSSSDETYQFAQGEESRFVSKFQNDFYSDLYGINMVVLTTDTGIIFEKYFLNDSNTPPPERDALVDSIQVVSLEAQANLDQLIPGQMNSHLVGRTGFIFLNNSLYFLAVYPILHNDDTGPSLGTLTFGRRIDQEHLNQTIDLGSGTILHFVTPEALATNPDLTPQNHDSLTHLDDSFIKRAEDIVFYVPLANLHGNTACFIEIVFPRVLFQQGNTLITKVVVLVVAAVLLLMSCYLLFVKRTVINPLNGLIQDLSSLRTGTSKNQYVKENYIQPEFRLLSETINVMLDRTASDKLKLRHLAYYDEASSLPNRMFLVEKIEQRLAENPEDSFYLLVARTDDYKRISTMLGRKASEGLMRLMGLRLQALEADPHICISTVVVTGAGEFAMLVEHLPEDTQENPVSIQRAISHLHAAFHDPFMITKLKISLSISLGICDYPYLVDSIDALFKNANLACDKASENSRQKYLIYDKILGESAEQQLVLENRINLAIERNEFELYFQPKVNVATQKISSCEALIRWHSPDYGFVLPGSFIPQATKNGAIIPISKFVLASAAQKSRAWRDQGIEITIAVNMPAQYIFHGDFLNTLKQLLAEYQLPPNALEMEITEDAFIENTEISVNLFQELKELGIPVAQDDFGIGYSSMNYLKQFFISRIKIDRSFISNIPNSNNDSAIVNAVCAMAKEMQIDLTAEGVETQTQYQTVVDLGCEEVQGFIFATPLPEQEFIKYVQAFEKVQKRDGNSD